MDRVPTSVGAEIFVALINPAISLVFALAFLGLWLHQHRRRGILVFAVSYALAGAGFLIQYFGEPVGFEASRLVSNGMFLLSAVTLAMGIMGGYDRPLPWVPTVCLVTAAFGMMVWFLFFQPSLIARIYAINFGIGGVCLMIAAEMRCLAVRRPVDTALMLLTLVAGLSFFARTLVVLATDPGATDLQVFFASLYWTSLTLTWAVLSILIALAVMARAGIDAMREIAELGEVDGLTGLLSRRTFEQRAAALLKAGPAVLILADLDAMASVNDTYGRPAGDLVLAGFARRLKQMAGRQAICARIGGDEFGVLVPGAALNEALALAEGVRVRFGRAGAPGLPGGIGRVTASFGVARHVDGESYADLQRRCDEAVFVAKRRGRDQVVSAKQPETGWLEPSEHRSALA